MENDLRLAGSAEPSSPGSSEPVSRGGVSLSGGPRGNGPMSPERRNLLTSGVKITSLGTLASRVLGLAREVANANVLGMSQGGVMDAFAIAFQIPNLFRGLFGEGALAVSYLPVVTTLIEQDRQRAWQLTSVALTWLTVILSGLVVLGEALCGLVWLGWGSRPGMSELMGLTAVMLPYLLLHLPGGSALGDAPGPDPF